MSQLNTAGLIDQLLFLGMILWVGYCGYQYLRKQDDKSETANRIIPATTLRTFLFILVSVLAFVTAASLFDITP